MPARDFGRFPGIVVSLAMVWRLDWEDEFTNWKNMFGNRCGNVQKFGATSICHDSAYGKRLVGLCFNMPGGGHPIRQAHGGSTKSTGSLSCSNKKHAMFFSGLTNFQTKNTKKHQKNREHLELLQLYHGWNTVSWLELGSTLFFVMAPDPCRYLDHFTGLNLHEQHEAVKMGGFFGIRFSVQYTICSTSSFWVYTFYIIWYIYIYTADFWWYRWYWWYYGYLRIVSRSLDGWSKKQIKVLPALPGAAAVGFTMGTRPMKNKVAR